MQETDRKLPGVIFIDGDVDIEALRAAFELCAKALASIRYSEIAVICDDPNYDGEGIMKRKNN